ncbi:8773_t:CDS:10 [Funneliformis geosporum]|uniref:8773_t:CDS:1 n=1 Tax=Funneliformis geosporum TaxID=1117311 RepID=A0A9W4STH2_9GLOM|nr:8773_t:CDS:10 [Funneliformis geosporum]
MSSENSTKEQGQNRHYISISRDGKYAVTFDAATLQFKVLKNTDHREFFTYNKKEEDESSEQDDSNEINENNAHSEINHEDASKEQKENKCSEISDTISHFRIKDNFFIEVFHNIPPSFKSDARVMDRWSIDISNIVKCDDKNFIFIAASKIENKYMKNTTTENSTRDENIRMIVKNHNGEEVFINIYPETITDLGTAIYCLKLNDGAENSYNKLEIIQYNYNRLSGICRFVEDIDEDQEGKQDFENYDCMDQLLSHIYKKYFVYEDDDKKVLEVYDLGEMKLETSIKIRDDDQKNNEKCLKVYSIDKQKLQFCIATGSQSIGIFLMEHGSRIASKSFEKFNIRKIHLIEFINSDEKLFLIVSDSTNDLKFIIWDIYDTDKVEIITLEDITAQNLSTCFANSSGNILHVNNEGKVILISKMVADKNIEKNLENLDLEEFIKETISIIKLDKQNHNIYFYAKEKERYKHEFEPAVSVPEPWITKSYEKISYYFCNNSIPLQLIVGRSTIQIWNRFNDETKLPNERRPFLEFIWTNGIPYNQENEEHKLHIESVQFGLNNFRLEVYWYENKWNEGESIYEESSMNKEKLTEKKMTQKMENMEKIDGMIIKKKIIEWSDINERLNGIRYACEALEFLNVRAKSLTSYDKIPKHNEMVKYINHIISRFAAKRPQRYRLLAIRYHVMKNLIFGDCNYLIHYLLFGSGKYLYVPKCKFWNEKRKYIIIDKKNPVNIKIDIENRNGLKNPRSCMNFANFNCRGRKELEYPTTDVNLAIYYCRNHKPKDTIIVAYVLQYYLLFADDFVNLLKTVSDAYFLLNILRYEEYTKMLKNEWHTFEKNFSKNPNDSKTPLEMLELLISKLKSPMDDLKNSRFTKFQRRKNNYILLKNIFLFIFIPRWYKTLQDQSKIIPYEDIDDMFDLPIIKESINHRWPSKKYLRIVFNWFDLLSIAMPAIVMTKLLIYTFKSSNGFGSVEAIDSQLIVEISWSTFIIWIEIVLNIRFIPSNAKYNKSLRAGFILLKNPTIKARDSTLSGNATNLSTNEILEIKLKSDFEPNDSNDNPYSTFSTSLFATYFWNNGDFVQRELFDFWSIEIFSIIASIFLVIILQNMLIAIMSNVYKSAAAKSNQAVLKYKAMIISDYYDLKHRFDFWYQDPEYVPSKKRIRNFYNDIYLDNHISEFAKELDYDHNSIWKFDKFDNEE